MIDPAQETVGARQFDFRSSLFQRDALWLAAVTGQAVWRCRQELFIAEGDPAEALAVLLGQWPLDEQRLLRH